jgi:hypothetical protein
MALFEVFTIKGSETMIEDSTAAPQVNERLHPVRR